MFVWGGGKSWKSKGDHKKGEVDLKGWKRREKARVMECAWHESGGLWGERTSKRRAGIWGRAATERIKRNKVNVCHICIKMPNRSPPLCITQKLKKLIRKNDFKNETTALSCLPVHTQTSTYTVGFWFSGLDLAPTVHLLSWVFKHTDKDFSVSIL